MLSALVEIDEDAFVKALIWIVVAFICGMVSLARRLYLRSRMPKGDRLASLIAETIRMSNAGIGHRERLAWLWGQGLPRTIASAVLATAEKMKGVDHARG